MPKRALWPAALLLFVVAGLLLYAHQLDPLPISRYTAFITLVILVASWLPAWLRPSPASRMAACYGTLMAGMMLYAFELDQGLPAGIPLFEAPFATNLRLVNGLFLLPAGYHTILLFPDESGRRQRWLPPAGRPALYYGIMALLLLALLLLPLSPLRRLFAITLLLFAGYLLVAALQLLLRLSKTEGPETLLSSQRARLILLAVVAANVPLIIRPTIAWLAGVNIPFTLVATAQLILPATLAYAILRHDLYGIDVRVRRALAATVSYTAIAGLFLFLTLIAANQVTQRVPAFARGLTFMTIVLAAITFRPLHQRLQQLIERRIYPEYAQFRRGVVEVEQALLTVRSPAELKLLFTEVLPARLGASRATWLPADSVTSTPETGWQGTVRLNGQPLAHFWLGERHSGVPYNNEEQRRLGQLLDRLALALAYAEAAAALQTLNQNLEATVSDRTEQLLQQQRSLAVAEERQRLARDLHDSVTQTLFSMGLSIRALARQVHNDPDAAVRGLGEQEQAAQGALAEMRALLTQLRAPLLADGDLVNALRVQAALLEQQTGFRVHIDAPKSLVLPPDVAQELLYVAREALHNAAKHSGVAEAHCELVLSVANLTMRIVDGGGGLEAAGDRPAGPNAAGGLGLQTMRERVQALRGELAIQSNRDGTCIQVTIPRHWRES